MPQQRVDLGFPFGGLNETAGYEEQPPGTSPDMLNVRPFDPQTDRRRGSQRAGVSKVTSSALSSGEPVRAIAAARIISDSGAISAVTQQAIDEFTRSDSSAASDALGDFDGDATADWTTATGTIQFSADGTIGASQFPTWDGVWSSGKGAIISSNTVIDDQDVTGLVGANVQFSANYFQPTDTTVADTDYVLRLKFRTRSSLASPARSIVGFFTNGSESTVTGGNEDDAAVFWITYDTANTRVNVVATVNDGSQDAISGSVIARPALFGNTTYTLELRKVGIRVDLYLDSTLIYRVDDITDGTAITSANTDYGFIIGNVKGSATNAWIEWVDDFEVYTAISDPPLDDNKIVAVCDMNIYVGDEDGDFSVASNGTGVNNDSYDTCLIVGPGPASDSGSGTQYVYMLDGQNDQKVDLSTSIASSWGLTTAGPSGGSAFPDGTYARYGVRWQNAAFLFGVAQEPDNWYMSRVGDFDDFDYVSNTDPYIAAVAGDTSDTRMPGAPISCCAPSRADWMLIAGRSQLWAMIGHPRQGGRLDDVSDRIGIVGPYAWTRDPRGWVYFVSLEGLHVLRTPAEDPIKLSENQIDRFFETIDHSKYLTRLGWDHRSQGVEIIFQRIDGTALSNSDLNAIFWDQRTGRFFPYRYPTSIRPTAIETFLSDTARLTLYGGPDGHVRKIDHDAASDDGLAIESHVVYAPIVGASMDQASLACLSAVMSSNTDLLNYEIRSGTDAETVLSESPILTGSWTSGRQPNDHVMTGGAAVSLRLYNDTNNSHWSLAKLAAVLERNAEVIER